MHRYFRCSATALVIVWLSAASLSAETIRMVNSISFRNVDIPTMTVREARKSLTALLGKLSSVRSVDNVLYTKRSVQFVAVYDFGRDYNELLKYNKLYRHRESIAGRPIPSRITFAGFVKVSVMNMAKGMWAVMTKREFYSIDDNDAQMLFFVTQQAAMEFAQAALNLKSAALSPDTEETDFAAFAANAQAWRATAPKHEMPDEARVFKLLAEEAFKRKDLLAALDAYTEALVRYPMWPEGQFNAALLAAETEDYESAAHHMRRYLVLAPDAKDAAASKDKLLLWQHKAKE